MNDTLGQQIIMIARRFPYPETPEISIPLHKTHSPIRFQLARAALIILLVFGGLMLIPPIRAAILDFFRIGAVEITITDVPVTLEPLPDVLANLDGRTTLLDAQQQVGFVLKLPAGYEEPDHVFVQGRNDSLVMMVWVDEALPDEVVMTLFQIDPSEDVFYKQLPELVETEVNGQDAVWLDVPHFISQGDNSGDWVHFVEGNVLIWTEDEITYRLETGLELEEAIVIAESLQ